MSTSHYPFGERAAALIGVKLNSAGDIEVLARSRTDLSKPMTSLLSAGPINVKDKPIEFTLTLAEPYVGLLALEVAGWIRPYEVNRTHFLGYSAPFSTDELDYDPKRDPLIPANREFTFTYSADGKLKVVDSLKSDYEEIDITSLDGVDGIKYTGKIFVVIRVTDANFKKGCATLSFKNGATIDGQSTFVLNGP